MTSQIPKAFDASVAKRGQYAGPFPTRFSMVVESDPLW